MYFPWLQQRLCMKESGLVACVKRHMQADSSVVKAAGDEGTIYEHNNDDRHFEQSAILKGGRLLHMRMQPPPEELPIPVLYGGIGFAFYCKIVHYTR